MRKNAKETSKRDGKVDLMKSVNYAERKRRADQMSMFESLRKKKDDESDFDDEEELGMSIANFSKSYNSSMMVEREPNRQTFHPQPVPHHTCETVLRMHTQQSLTLGQ